MDFFEVVETQRALRRFRPEPVTNAVLNRILDAATGAPPARGGEPWVFLGGRDRALREEIGRRYREAWEVGQRYTHDTDADRDVRDQPHYARMMRAAGELASTLHQAPVVIA